MLVGKTLEGQEKEQMSFEKLKKSTLSKMRTIMIGALADIEQHYELNDELRKSILDRGNNLIRVFEDELKQYKIEFKGYFTNFK